MVEYSGNRSSSSCLNEVHFIDQDAKMIDFIQRTFTRLFSTGIVPTPSKTTPSKTATLLQQSKSTSRSGRFTGTIRQHSVVEKHCFFLKENREIIKVLLYKGDLLAENVDAIVCPQDKNCLNYTQIAKELIKRGNERYKSDMNNWKSYDKPRLSQAVEMDTHESFPFKYVLHAVPPRWGEASSYLFDNDLKDTLVNVFFKAANLRLNSIALPVMGVGKEK